MLQFPVTSAISRRRAGRRRISACMMEEAAGDLSDEVLSWSLENIRDGSFFASKVEEIPDTFTSVEHYFGSFVTPLMEETRADLFSSLEVIAEAPYYTIQRIAYSTDTKKKSRKKRPSFRYFISVDFSEASSKVNDYMPRNGDVFILSSIKPEELGDLFQYGVNNCMALITDVIKNEDIKKGSSVKESEAIDRVDEMLFLSSLAFKTYEAIDIKDYASHYTFAVFLTNVSTNMRIWRALSFPSQTNDDVIRHDLPFKVKMDDNFDIINGVLFPDVREIEQCNGSACGHTNHRSTESWKLLISFDFNESQMHAVDAAVHSVHCSYSPPVQLIWGPPGTGKTKIISGILWSFWNMKIRTLTCAPTNIATVGICSRLLKQVNSSHGDAVSSESYISLGDVVLFGNRHGMQLDDDLQDVFLDNRVDVLAECFAPLTGWTHHLTTMMNFLQDSNCLYEQQCEISCREETMGFSNFVRKRFLAVARPLEDCARNLLMHLPTRYLSYQNARNLSSLLDLLGIFHRLLFDAHHSDEGLKEVFSHKFCKSKCTGVDGGSSIAKQGFPERMTIEEARIECLHLLAYLSMILILPSENIDKDAIRRFCFENAILIFCTASSSSSLHYVKMDRLDVVVIDEAAQLMECESVIPLRLNYIKKAILVGDECQLPSLVKSKISKEARFGVSLFERLGNLGYPKYLLNTQCRMHPSISSFPNTMFYEKQILDGPNVKAMKYNVEYQDLDYGPYAFIHVADGREERDYPGNSLRNMVEVAVILHLVRKLFKRFQESHRKLSIGIVSPYTAQVGAIKEKLGTKYEDNNGFEVRVKSIDGFQGQEDDVIILSTVRSNTYGNVGFLRDRQRTNVALTRARHCLWIVGDAKILGRSGTIWEDLVNDAMVRKCIFNCEDDERLSKAILHVKRELDQLEDLLNSDSVFLSGARWKVLFSNDFRKCFSRLKTYQDKTEIMKLLLRLAEGHRSERKNPFGDSFDLARVYRVKDLYMIWSVDVIKESRYIQVIRVWHLLPMPQAEKFITRLDHIFSMYTEVHLKHCKAVQVDGKTEVPVSWNIVQDIARYKKLSKLEPTVGKENVDTENSSVMENSKVSESLLLMKFYLLSTGIAKHLLTAGDGTELAVPFELTDLEEEIIRFPSTSFILGRSGTGKTTVLTVKLVQKEQQYSIASANVDLSQSDSNNDSEEIQEKVIKQVFITVSSKLCSAIRSHVLRLKSFASGDQTSDVQTSLDMHDINEEFELLEIPNSLCCLPQRHYPLVITFWKFLLMLDGTMERSFFDKYYSTASSAEVVDLVSFAPQALMKSKEVTYEKFAVSYWPHFNSQLTKSLDASTVFLEIISHIKGGIDAGKANGRLEKEDYVMLSERRVSRFGREVREKIYDIFLDYELEKCMAREFDISDFVNHLHDQIVSNGYAGDTIDFVYIDEVQDLTMSQIALLKYVCKNFKEGFTFAGDTAQTIARGVDFRFEDIRSLFYTEFLSVESRKHQQNTKETEVLMHDMFQLYQNFRTHDGILKLAQSVVEVLYYFFPFSVDKLMPEVSLLYGEAPMLLESENDENAIITIFGSTSSKTSASDGFGAEQVILVRDDAAKKQVVDLVGKQALVLTIVECKGLEFQDVLLYNFFGSSPLKNKWRVVYQYMNGQGILESSITRSFPCFDQEKHNLLCSELKQLYVAITRTRQRLWICENADEYSKPMFDYWKKLCLVQVRHLDIALAQAMRAGSSAEDWRLRGIKLFNEGQFEMATMCFEKSGDDYREKWARAAGLFATADRLNSVKAEMGDTALLKAAEIYESIGKMENAATCYVKLKDFKRAVPDVDSLQGLIYLENCGSSRLESAAECFSNAQMWEYAAQAYAKARCFSKCLSICSREELFETGLHVIEQWKREVETSFDQHELRELNEVKLSYLEKCAQRCFDIGDMSRMLVFLKAFSSIDVVRQFLKSRNLLQEMLEVEVEMGNYFEAAKIARSQKNILLEVDMLEKANSFGDAARLLIFYVVMQSLWERGNKGWPLKKFAEKEELLTKAKVLAKMESSTFHEYVTTLANILSDRKKTLSEMSRHFDEALNYPNLHPKIFSLQRILGFHIVSHPSNFFCELDSPANREHANEIMDQNKISSETLMYTWDLWKTLIHDMLFYLHNPVVTNEIYEEFYLNYFGIRKDEDLNVCVPQNVNAVWIETSELSSLEKTEMSLSLTPFQCMSCAQHYWKVELSSVGMKILEKLESLHTFASQRKSSLLSKLKIVIYIYKVAKYLMESELVVSRAKKNIKRYFNLAKESYFDMVFPLDWKSQTVATVDLLHANDTGVEIIEVFLVPYLTRWNGNLSHGFIASLVMSIFLTGRLTDNLFTDIKKSLSNKPAWNDFMENLKTFLDFGYTRIPLITNFKDALQSTFVTDWSRQEDYVSPHCFLYLVDCLMFCASSCQGYQGHFFTTKSTVIEMLKCRGCNGYISNCLVAAPDGQLKASVAAVLDYIINTIQQILCDKRSMKDWIKKTSVPMHFYSEMVLKLVIMLYVAFLNIGTHTNSVCGFLSRHRILEDLPQAFSKRLNHATSFRGRAVNSFLKAFAEALRTVENPLIVVCSRQTRYLFTDINASVICSDEIRCRENILELLFPEIKNQNIGSAGPSYTTHTSDIGNKIESADILSPEPKRKEVIELGGNDSNECPSYRSYEVDNFNSTVISLITTVRERNPVNCEELISKLINIQDDLKQFSILRDEGASHDGKCLAGLESKWQALKSSLEPILNSLVPQNEGTEREVSPSDQDGNNNPVREPIPEVQELSQSMLSLDRGEDCPSDQDADINPTTEDIPEAQEPVAIEPSSSKQTKNKKAKGKNKKNKKGKR